MDVTAFPGAALILAGIADLERGRESIEAMLVSIGAHRLRRAGIAVPAAFDDAERRLYDTLASTDSDSAHSRYNALIRQLVSFEHAAECARR